MSIRETLYLARYSFSFLSCRLPFLPYLRKSQIWEGKSQFHVRDAYVVRTALAARFLCLAGRPVGRRSHAPFAPQIFFPTVNVAHEKRCLLCLSGAKPAPEGLSAIERREGEPVLGRSWLSFPLSLPGTYPIFLLCRVRERQASKQPRAEAASGRPSQTNIQGKKRVGCGCRRTLQTLAAMARLRPLTRFLSYGLHIRIRVRASRGIA